MVELEFDYFQDKMKLKFNLSDDFESVFDKYCLKTGIEKNSVIFKVHNLEISGDKKIIDIMNNTERLNNKMNISVFRHFINPNDKVIEQSKEIICPKCSEQCRIKINDYFIDLFDCKNNHSTILKLNEFNESQNINFADIKCNICNTRSIEHSYENNFYYCQNCKMNICYLCKEKHNNNHFIINYEQKNYICKKHNDSFFKYCHDCKINICKECKQDHFNHNIESFENIIANPDDKRRELDKLKKEIDIFNNNVKKIING